MRRVAGSLALLLLLAATVINAQNEPKAPPKLVFKTTGETVYEFAVEVALEPTPDVGSAKGVVLAWSHIANNPEDFGDALATPDAEYNGLANKAMSELEKGLLTEDLAAKAGEQRTGEQYRERSYQSARRATVVESEEVQEDGSVLITTSQERVSRYKNKDGEWQTGEPRKNWYRYHVVKGEDGKWRIDSVESGAEDSKESTKEKPVLRWDDWRNTGLEIAYEFAKSEKMKLKKPELAAGTTKEAAMAFIALRDFNSDAQFNYFGVLCLALEKATKALFTGGYIDGVHKASDERAAKNKKKDDPAPEIEELRDETETSATVVFKKTDSKASDKLVVKVEKDGEAWRVTEVGTLREAGTEEERYEPKEKIYNRW